MSIALALGQIEEAMGRLLDGDRGNCRQEAYAALVRAREYLAEAIAAEAARVPLAHYTPITAEEVGP